jgi:hypothetical protein
MIANAVFRLTGVHLRAMPMLLARVKAALAADPPNLCPLLDLNQGHQRRGG